MLIALALASNDVTSSKLYASFALILGAFTLNYLSKSKTKIYAKQQSTQTNRRSIPSA